MEETNSLKVEENQRNRILEIISEPESIGDLCSDMDLDQIGDFYIEVENLSKQLSTSRYRMEEIGKKFDEFYKNKALYLARNVKGECQKKKSEKFYEAAIKVVLYPKEDGRIKFCHGENISLEKCVSELEDSKDWSGNDYKTTSEGRMKKYEEAIKIAHERGVKKDIKKLNIKLASTYITNAKELLSSLYPSYMPGASRLPFYHSNLRHSLIRDLNEVSDFYDLAGDKYLEEKNLRASVECYKKAMKHLKDLEEYATSGAKEVKQERKEKNLDDSYKADFFKLCQEKLKYAKTKRKELKRKLAG